MLAFGMWSSKWRKQWSVCLSVCTIWSVKYTSLLGWQQVSLGFRFHFQRRQSWPRPWILVVVSCAAPQPLPHSPVRQNPVSSRVRWSAKDSIQGNVGQKVLYKAEDVSTLSGATAVLQVLKVLCRVIGLWLISVGNCCVFPLLWTRSIFPKA